MKRGLFVGRFQPTVASVGTAHCLRLGSTELDELGVIE